MNECKHNIHLSYNTIPIFVVYIEISRVILVNTYRIIKVAFQNNTFEKKNKNNSLIYKTQFTISSQFIDLKNYEYLRCIG